MYLTEAEEDQWGVDLLGGVPLPVGGTRVLQQVPCPEQDVKLTSAGDCVFESMYLCLNNPSNLSPELAVAGADSTWHIRASDVQGCPNFAPPRRRARPRY
jgi:hypothetical protein